MRAILAEAVRLRRPQPFIRGNDEADKNSNPQAFRRITYLTVNRGNVPRLLIQRLPRSSRG